MLDLDQFGEVMDNLLRDNEIQMLITMPKGTQEATIVDNLGLGGVVQLYICLNGIEAAVKNCAEFWKDADAEKIASAIAGLVEKDIQEAILKVQEAHDE